MAGKSGNKTFGRNKTWCLAYRLSRRREKNKKIKIMKHLKKHPNDKVSLEALEKL